jgi:hypothetical protein
VRPVLTVTQAGECGVPETLLRYQRAIGGCGVIYGPVFAENRKPRYVFTVRRIADVLKARDALWPWLGVEKRNQFTERLAEYQEGRDALAERRRWCPQGHEYTPENTYQPNTSGSGKSCKECGRIRARDYQRRRRAELKSLSSTE